MSAAGRLLLSYVTVGRSFTVVLLLARRLCCAPSSLLSLDLDTADSVGVNDGKC